jgi:hypothetical protein
MGEVVSFRGVTRLDLDVDRMLENTKGQLENCVIMGYDKQGDFFFSSSMADGGDVMWLLEMLKLKLLTVYTDGED